MIWPEYYRAVEISKIRQYMRYDETQFKEDCDVAIALIQLMAMHGPLQGQERQLQSCFTRMEAYMENMDW